jgi:hypothetical protein
MGFFDKLKVAAEAGRDLAKAGVAAARDNDTVRKVEILAREKIEAVQQSETLSRAKATVQTAVGEAVYQVQHSNLAQQLSEAATAAMHRVHDMTDVEKHKWRNTVRDTISNLPNYDAAHFLSKLQPAALVEALRVDYAIDLIRCNTLRAQIDFNPAEALYPGLIQHISSHIALDSDTQTITRGVAAIAIHTVPANKVEHGMTM